MRTNIKTLRNYQLHSRGDTIVEVLIALAIISLVLVVAYATTSSSTQSLQDTQEHREASAIAQTQLEFLRGSTELDTAASGCFDDSGTPVTRSSSTCRFDASGGTSACTDSAACFLVDITKNGTHIYTVNVTWEGLRGKGNAVAMVYQMPPLLAASSGGGGSGGGGGGGSGDAEIDAGTCDGPGLPACPPPGPGGSYHYTFVFINQSKNPVANIVSCTWDWGDGTPAQSFPGSNPICQEGNNSPPHTYPTLSPEPPYPAGCVQIDTAGLYYKQYTATLRMNLTGGITKTDSREVVVPNCY